MIRLFSSRIYNTYIEDDPRKLVWVLSKQQNYILKYFEWQNHSVTSLLQFQLAITVIKDQIIGKQATKCSGLNEVLF